MTDSPAAHPATNLFPLMGDDDLRALAADITAQGLLHPVVLHEGRVLDGRNRLRACELAGVEPRFETWQPNGKSPTEWVISTNLHRRHLTISQRAAIAVEMLPLLEAEAKQRQGQRTDLRETSVSIDTEVPQTGRSREIAAEQLQVSPASVARATYLAKHHPDVFEDVKEGKTTLNAASVMTGWEGRRAQQAGRDHPPQEPPERLDKSRAGTAARRERIAKMAAEGYHEDAIADAVGVDERTVRAFMYEQGIPTLASKIGKMKRPDADRIMEGIVTTAAPAPEALAAIDWSALDRGQFEDWERRLGEAIRLLSRVRDRLRRER